MTVYLEDVIIQNMLINCMLLYFVCRTVRRRFIVWRIVLASSLGTAFALVLPLIDCPEFVYVFCKFAVGAAVTAAAIPVKSTKFFILFYTLFLGYTFSFGGAVGGYIKGAAEVFEKLIGG